MVYSLKIVRHYMYLPWMNAIRHVMWWKIQPILWKSLKRVTQGVMIVLCRVSQDFVTHIGPLLAHNVRFVNFALISPLSKALASLQLSPFVLHLIFQLYWKILHSSEIRGLCLIKWPGKTLQNLLYFIYTKAQISFFHFSFRATLYFYLMNALVYAYLRQYLPICVQDVGNVFFHSHQELEHREIC